MKTSIRTCAGCGAKRPKHEMIRVGAGAGGKPCISARGKAPGRGAYICPEPRCLALARGSGGLARALRRNIPESLMAELELEIERRQKV